MGYYRGKYTLDPAAELRLMGTEIYRRLDEVLDKAAIVSHPRGNRRYHNWIFRVVGDVVVSAGRLEDAPPVQTTAPSDPNTFIAYEQCDACADYLNGHPHCGVCGGTGEIKVTRTIRPFDKRRLAR